jgi:SAM-dependent methyltransferase
MSSSDKLHLGAYNIIHEGWINTDVTKHLWIARIPKLAGVFFKLGLMTPDNYRRHQEGIFKQIHYLNVTKRFPYPDNTFRYVFSAHMLEHLYPDEAEFCLREVRRVLQPGGLVRIVIPDLDRIVASYDPHNPEPTLDSIYQGNRRNSHERARHWWHYNETSLRALLQRIGFGQIERCQYQQGRCADVERIDNRPDSLFMEAVK